MLAATWQVIASPLRLVVTQVGAHITYPLDSPGRAQDLHFKLEFRVASR